MPNIATIISVHKKQVMNPRKETHSCNCCKKSVSSQINASHPPSYVYEATITNDKNDEKKTYIEASATSFKDRFRNHTKDMKHRKYSKSTKLLKYIWELKDKGMIPAIQWKTQKQFVVKHDPITYYQLQIMLS